MIQAILTDIEGTTSSLSFVKDVLFPYSRRHIADFVRAHAGDAAVRRLLDDARREIGGSPTDDEVIAGLIRWIDQDRKITPLKALQGMIWETGYRQGGFKGHMYEDAARNLRKWHAGGVRLYVFSSGSVQAQKLLFAHTEYGDLTPLFSGYFDTTFGAKREAESYRRIAAAIGLPPARGVFFFYIFYNLSYPAPPRALFFFLSYIMEDRAAARAAGMRTTQLVREGTINARAPHPQVNTFDAVNPDWRGPGGPLN